MAKKRRGPIKGLVGGQYKPLTNEQVQQIHRAALSILERTGIVVEETEALRLFEKAGATIDRKALRVRIPRNSAKKRDEMRNLRKMRNRAKLLREKDFCVYGTCWRTCFPSWTLSVRIRSPAVFGSL